MDIGLEIVKWTGIIFLCWLFFALVIARIARHLYHFPIPGFLTRLIDNPLRRRFVQNPGKIAANMHLQPGMVALEIGPGKGSYTKGVAAAVLPGGIVHALDIDQGIIDRLQRHVEKEHLFNIQPAKGDAYAMPFDESSIDRIFMVTCLPEIPDRVRVLKECCRVLKSDGMLSTCELFLDPDYPLRRTEIKWAIAAGFELVESTGTWFAYQLNFKKRT
jgi:ubiquinone/menaquinone biosynthesis C-methylase UbiE